MDSQASTKHDRAQQVAEMVGSALDREPREWSAFLDEACDGDSALRAEVESLLQCREQAHDFIEAPVFSFAIELLEDESEPLEGNLVGPYQIIRRIGRGGMGDVYLASRADDQYRKEVAIKLVKRGFDTDDIRRRFRHERQILATLDHPNIARLIDGGTTETGLPYFVMDYVDGIPLNRYCDERKLNITERLKLFRTVCAAVHYAHQHLVIHCDIKPGNILVTEDGVPKLLDCGIAKLLDPDLSQTAGHTVTELKVMTPEYASPEQVRGEQVTTATDTYSLGVLLYELLTGHRPYRIKSRRPDEVARVICEEEPSKPSLAVSGQWSVVSGKEQRAKSKGPGEQSSSRAVPTDNGQKANPQSAILNPKFLRGDLDNIVLMAMRKEPERRYASVEQFSEDMRRYLEGLPVVAHKDTFSYRTAKFVRRHKAGAAAAALIVLTLVAGVATVVRQARIATEQRDRARIEAAKSDRINKFLQDMFASADPSWYSPGRGKHGDVKVRDVLDEAGSRIDTEMSGQPEIRAELHHTIGNTYLALGFFDKAEQHFRSSLEIYRELYGERHPKVAESLYYLSAPLADRGDDDAALPLLRRAIEIMRAADPGNTNLPYMLQDFGGLLIKKGDASGAEPFVREGLTLFRQRYGENHVGVAGSYKLLGMIYERRGQMDQAEAMYRESIERHHRLPPDQQVADSSLIELANLLLARGEYAEPEALLQEALDDTRSAPGDGDPLVLQCRFYLARLHYLKADYARAEQEAGALLAIEQQTLPEEHALLVGTLSLLSEIIIKAGEPRRAEPYLRRALELQKKAIREGHPDPETSGVLGECLVLLKRDAEAEPLLVESYNDMKASLGEKHPRSIEALQRLITLYRDWKKPDTAAQFSAMLSQ